MLKLLSLTRLMKATNYNKVRRLKVIDNTEAEADWTDQAMEGMKYNKVLLQY